MRVQFASKLQSEGRGGRPAEPPEPPEPLRPALPPAPPVPPVPAGVPAVPLAPLAPPAPAPPVLMPPEPPGPPAPPAVVPAVPLAPPAPLAPPVPVAPLAPLVPARVPPVPPVPEPPAPPDPAAVEPPSPPLAAAFEPAAVPSKPPVPPDSPATPAPPLPAAGVPACCPFSLLELELQPANKRTRAAIRNTTRIASYLAALRASLQHFVDVQVHARRAALSVGDAQHVVQPQQAFCGSAQSDCRTKLVAFGRHELASRELIQHVRGRDAQPDAAHLQQFTLRRTQQIARADLEAAVCAHVLPVCTA